MAYTPPLGTAVDFGFGPGGYTPPAGDAVHFNFGGIRPRSRLGAAYSVTAVGRRRAGAGAAWATVGVPSQRSRLGDAWITLSGGGVVARVAAAWQTIAVGGGLARLGSVWDTQGVRDVLAALGAAYGTLIYSDDTTSVGGAYVTAIYEVRLTGLWAYWGYLVDVGRAWRLVSGYERARTWRLPATILGDTVARAWEIDSTFGGVGRAWSLPSHMGVDVARAWALTSRMITQVGRAWTLNSPIATTDPVARAWRLPSPMIDDAEIVVVGEAYATVDGRKVELDREGVSLHTDEGTFGWTCRMALARVSDYDLFTAETRFTVTIGGEEYSFIFDGKQKPRSSQVRKSAVISGITPCMVYEEPRAPPLTKTWTTAMRATDLFAELFPGEAVEWGILDWSIPSPRLSAANESPRKIMQRVLSAIGALLECDRDGTLLVRYQYPVSVPDYATAVPDQVYSDIDHNRSIDEGIQLAALVNKIRIMDVATSGFQDRIEFVPDAGDHTRGILKVWPNPWRETFDVSHTSLPIVSVSRIGVQTEVLVETVEVLGGTGSVAKPIYTIDDFEFLYDDLGGIVADTDATEFATTSTALFESLVRITYTTRYVAYNAVAYDGAQVQFLVREPEDV